MEKAYRTLVLWALAAAVSAFLGLTAGTVRAQVSLGDLSGPWQLFVDDYMVESKTNLTRTYHAFEKYPGNPVLTPTKPWEAKIVYIYGTVLPNPADDGYRMWYHTMRPEDPADDGSNILYATSPDGVNWHKPNLYINSWHGSSANNMIFDRPTISGITSVIHTPFDPDPNKAYKLFNYEPGMYYGAWSADGIHTVDVPNNPIITGVGDVAMASWDPHTGKYLAYVKINTYVNGLKRRSVALCTSDDFLSWTSPQLVLEPDSYDDRWVPAGTVQCTHFYGLCAFAYESMYMGILWIFRATDAEGYYIGPVYAEIVSSRDGINWTRQEAPRPPMLPLGPPGAWDDGQLYTAIAPVYRDGKLAIYYGACDDVHGYATKKLNCNIGLATLRKDGFASLTAGAVAGSVTTRALNGMSGELHVNYQGNGGWLKVEVLDASGAVIPGYSQADCVPLQGDSIDEVVVWDGQTALPASGDPIKLRFVLQSASLFSFKSATPTFDPPVITSQPVDKAVTGGGTAVFTIQAQGSLPLSYQWQINGTNISDGPNYSGCTSNQLTVTNVGPESIGQYACVVSNAHGTVVSSPANLLLSQAQFTALPQGTTVTGISADGSVVCGTTSSNVAFIWTKEHGFKSLGVPGGASQSRAAGVGVSNGNVVVAINSNAASFKARLWEGSAAGTGSFTSLPLATGSLEWTASGLGTDGGSQVWISGSTPNGGDGGGRRAVRYSRSTNTTVSFALPTQGHDNSDFHAVADNGWCGGQYQYKGIAPGGGARNPMVYMGGSQSAPLNTLMGPPSTSYEAVVRAMSRSGQVQGGWSYYPGGSARQKPVVWQNSVTPTAVDFIPGGDGDNWGEILAINGDGTLAGGYSQYRGTPDGPSEALIWSPGAGTRRYHDVVSEYGIGLNGWLLQDIRGISADSQVVVGNGTFNGQQQAWMVSFSTGQPPSISGQPQAQHACPGSTVLLTVSAGGPDPLQYEWQLNGAGLSEGGQFAGTDSPALTVLDVNAGVVGNYRCVVTSLAGAAVSDSAPLSLQRTGPADLDDDCDIDLDDFELLMLCTTGPGYSGPAPQGCEQALFQEIDCDADGDIDQTDFGCFQRCLSGSGQEPSEQCSY